MHKPSVLAVQTDNWEGGSTAGANEQVDSKALDAALGSYVAAINSLTSYHTQHHKSKLDV